MGEAIYVLCALTSLGCAGLLFRGYRRSRTHLLFWSSVCFVGLALNNILLLLDFLVFPAVDLRIVRSVVALASVLLFIWGLMGVNRGESR